MGVGVGVGVGVGAGRTLNPSDGLDAAEPPDPPLAPPPESPEPPLEQAASSNAVPTATPALVKDFIPIPRMISWYRYMHTPCGPLSPPT
ncbi:hypothetical protein GCM10009639_63310 [Kitasatospora putterlickiae]|uniref:Uncharacterized protein n=1 Tax=Kitasatospora putterlickiae TaxID=221725 RepID=A0ABN1YG77_9ACTN